jgi:bifunctional non-homologous end joining protein LigD
LAELRRVLAYHGVNAPPRRLHGPCIPTAAHKRPVGPQWIHEIKHDGYRLIVCRRDGRVRLFTHRGYDWSDRYPLVVATTNVLPTDVTIEGEVVVCDEAGVADFEHLHSREHDRVAFLYAFRPPRARGYRPENRPLWPSERSICIGS